MDTAHILRKLCAPKNLELCLQLVKGASRLHEEMPSISRCETSLSFRDIARDGKRRADKLIRNRVSSFQYQPIRKRNDPNRKVNGGFPHE